MFHNQLEIEEQNWLNHAKEFCKSVRTRIARESIGKTNAENLQALRQAKLKSKRRLAEIIELKQGIRDRSKLPNNHPELGEQNDIEEKIMAYCYKMYRKIEHAIECQLEEMDEAILLATRYPNSEEWLTHLPAIYQNQSDVVEEYIRYSTKLLDKSTGKPGEKEGRAELDLFLKNIENMDEEYKIKVRDPDWVDFTW